MSEPPPIIEAADAFLGRLATLDMQAAEHVHGCLLDRTEPSEVAELARAYARASRRLRQTLALHARLKADREKAAREVERHAAQMARDPAASATGPNLPSDPDQIYSDDKVEDLRDAVERVISQVADGDLTRHTRLVHRFERELDDWIDAPDFLDAPLDRMVERACRTLDLPETLARTWRDLPPAAFFPEPEELSAFDDADDDAETEGDAPRPHDLGGPPDLDAPGGADGDLDAVLRRESG